LSDVVVIGASADGLVAAHLLAGRGHRVTLIEEHAPPARTVGWVPAELQRELALTDLALACPDPWLRAPLPAGGALELWQDMARSVESIRRISVRDAERWPAFCERMAALRALIERIYLEPPPSLVDMRFALRVRRLGRGAMEDLMRVLPMPIAELLDDWFESDVLKGALATFAVRHLQQGPRSAGTAFRLLHYHAGSPTGVFRTPSTNLAAQLRSRPGITVRTSKASRITVRSGRVTGAVLDGGEELRAELVVSAADPRRTLLELVAPGWLDPDLARAVQHIRTRGVALKLSLELEQPAAWNTLTLAPSLDYVERAYDDVKYRRPSAQPWIDAIAEGKRVDVHIQYAPNGEGDAAIGAKLLAPHLPLLVKSTAVASHAWPDAQPHQAELALDQALWMRPLPELARYRTPVDGLWLGGGATHPAIPGVCGYNCARQILRGA
jgi:phytoene dehydrogenase-like protein